MKSYYECHITMESNKFGDALKVHRALIEKAVNSLKWKFSAIDGDIVMGKGVKYYATRHYNARLGEDEVYTQLEFAAECLKLQGIKVVRRKIEKVIFDDRSSKVRPCNGGCVECHLDDYSKCG